MKKNKIIDTFMRNLEDLKNNINKYLPMTRNVGGDFGGPSVYFHKKALIEMKRDFLGDNHLEMIYAVMPSWGMHRMGEKGAKMVGFEKFKDNILKNKDEILSLKNENLMGVNIKSIAELITNKIHVSATNSQLVASAKVLHHIIPNIVCPIDRNYSIKFMIRNKDSFDKDTPDFNNETAYTYANVYLEGMRDFLMKHGEMVKTFINEPNEDNISDTNFNTSCTKIFDNLIMVYVKKNKKKS